MCPSLPCFSLLDVQVLALLRRYLGEYVRNIPDEALKISVWQGKGAIAPRTELTISSFSQSFNPSVITQHCISISMCPQHFISISYRILSYHIVRS